MDAHDDILRAKRAAEGALLAIPGVHAVAIGAKVVAGTRTDPIAIAVFVKRKKALADLRAEEVIPANIGGFVTDVHEADVPRLHTRYRPLVGGGTMLPRGYYGKVTGLGNSVTPPSGLGGQGTMGCVALTGGAKTTLVALTVAHLVDHGNDYTPADALTVSAPSPNVVEFGGTNVPGALIVLRAATTAQPPVWTHVFYRTVESDDPIQIATKLAATINATPGLQATLSGAQVTLSGANAAVINCNVYAAPNPNSLADIVANVDGNVITIRGTASSACAVYLKLNTGNLQATYGVFVPIAANATRTAVAPAIAQAINGRNIPNVTATETDPAAPGGPATVTVQGVQSVDCVVSSDIRVGQPTNKYCSKCCNCCNDIVGRVLDARVDVDTALIQIDPTWVAEYKAEIDEIGAISGTADITTQIGATVQTRGAMTDQVKQGTVVFAHYSGDIHSHDEAHNPPQWTAYGRFFTEAVLVQGTPAGTAFSEPGDSGAAVLTTDNKVAGILFGSSSTGTLVTPIAQIIAAFPALALTIPTEASTTAAPLPVPALAPVAQATAMQAAEDAAELAKFTRREREISAIPAGRQFSAVVQQHYGEAQGLVNSNRRVAATWHRNGGPRIARSVMQMADSRDVSLPQVIDGKPLVECLAAIEKVFRRYASEGFVADLDRYGSDLLRFAPLSYAEALEELRAMSAHRTRSHDGR